MTRFQIILVLLTNLVIKTSIGQNTCISGDCQNGSGKLKYSNGAVYYGEFNQGSLHGTGTYNYASGDRYEGEFMNGTFNGYGVYHDKSTGHIYDAHYKNGKKYGLGYFYNEFGYVVQLDWREDTIYDNLSEKEKYNVANFCNVIISLLAQATTGFESIRGDSLPSLLQKTKAYESTAIIFFESKKSTIMISKSSASITIPSGHVECDQESCIKELQNYRRVLELCRLPDMTIIENDEGHKSRIIASGNYSNPELGSWSIELSTEPFGIGSNLSKFRMTLTRYPASK